MNASDGKIRRNISRLCAEFGAQGETRTHTPVKAGDFESPASCGTHCNFFIYLRQFLRAAYTAISASQHSNHINGCVPMCDRMCPNIRGGAWATLSPMDTYYQTLPWFSL